jgi:hypothetical protein
MFKGAFISVFFILVALGLVWSQLASSQRAGQLSRQTQEGTAGELGRRQADSWTLGET